MPRIARKDYETSFFHVMVQGINKEYIFDNKNDARLYLSLVSKKCLNNEYELLAYCIMNNHAHLLFWVDNINRFEEFMHRNNLIYAQRYNRKKERCGVVFRNRYKVEPIYDIRHLGNCIKYIHNNPVKAGIVEKCEDYSLSSYRDYMQNIGVSKSKILSDVFGEKANFLEIINNSYEKKFIDDGDDDSQKYILDGIKEFTQMTENNLVNIFSETEVLCQLFSFLKNKWNINYLEIQRFFNISSNTYQYLKTKVNQMRM